MAAGGFRVRERGRERDLERETEREDLERDSRNRILCVSQIPSFALA